MVVVVVVLEVKKMVERSQFLQLKTYKVKSKEESCINPNTRELNRVISIMYLHYIHYLVVCARLILTYSKGYVLFIRSIYGRYAV